jgi:hypothetical protein
MSFLTPLKLLMALRFKISNFRSNSAIFFASNVKLFPTGSLIPLLFNYFNSLEQKNQVITLLYLVKTLQFSLEILYAFYLSLNSSLKDIPDL